MHIFTFCLLIVAIPVLIVKWICDSIYILIVSVKDKLVKSLKKEEDKKDCIYYVGFYREEELALRCAVNPMGNCLKCQDYQKKLETKDGKYS